MLAIVGDDAWRPSSKPNRNMSARLLSSALWRSAVVPLSSQFRQYFQKGNFLVFVLVFSFSSRSQLLFAKSVAHPHLRFASRFFSTTAPTPASSHASSSSTPDSPLTQKQLEAAEAAVDAELAQMTDADVAAYRDSVLGDVDAEAEADVKPNNEDVDDEVIDDEVPIDPQVASLLAQVQASAQAVRQGELISQIKSPTQRAWMEQLRLDVESLNRFGVTPRVAAPGGHGVAVEEAEVYFTFRAFDLQLLRSFTERLAQKALALQLDCFSVVPLPTKIKRWTVQSSPFVDKEARTQFEMRVHKRLVVVKTRGLEKRLRTDRFDHWAAQARIHRLIEVFMRFMPGIQVTFHHKVFRRV